MRRTILILFGVLTIGCSSESTFVPCKDGVALTASGEEGHATSTLTFTLGGVDETPRVYRASTGKKESTSETFELRVFPNRQSFVIFQNDMSPIAAGTWASWAKSDQIDLDVHTCPRDSVLTSLALSLGYVGDAHDFECVSRQTRRTSRSFHRTAYGHLFAMSDGQMVINAEGPNISLDLATEVSPSTYTVTADTCVLAPWRPRAFSSVRRGRHRLAKMASCGM